MSRVDGEIFGYDGHAYRRGIDMVRSAKKELDGLDLTAGLKVEVLSLLRATTLGQHLASEAIHHPALTEIARQKMFDETGNVGSPSDYLTDSNDLRFIPDIFPPSKEEVLEKKAQEFIINLDSITEEAAELTGLTNHQSLIGDFFEMFIPEPDSSQSIPLDNESLKFFNRKERATLDYLLEKLRQFNNNLGPETQASEIIDKDPMLVVGFFSKLGAVAQIMLHGTESQYYQSPTSVIECMGAVSETYQSLLETVERKITTTS